MQILHFDWLRYQGTIRSSHRAAKFAAFSFVFSPNNYFFNLHLLTLSLSHFLSNQLGDTKTIRLFAPKGHGSIAHSASPHGLLTRSPSGLGLRVKLLSMLKNLSVICSMRFTISLHFSSLRSIMIMKFCRLRHIWTTIKCAVFLSKINKVAIVRVNRIL